MIAAIVLILGATAPPAAASTSTLNTAEFDEAVANYFADHPGDWVGAAQFVESLGGTLTVSAADGSITTPEAADAAVEAASTNQTFGPQAWPIDAFTAFVGVSSDGPSDPTVTLVGAWNFKDDFLGQGAPVDIAALLINKSCGTWSAYEAHTYTYQGVQTHRSTLRSGGTGTNGPIWNISDYISNFMSYADSGTVLAKYNRSSCPSSGWDSIQGEFVYEGNDGGSVIGVDAGWGGFGVSYENPGETMTKSSGALTVEYP